MAEPLAPLSGNERESHAREECERLTRRAADEHPDDTIAYTETSTAFVEACQKVREAGSDERIPSL